MYNVVFIEKKYLTLRMKNAPPPPKKKTNFSEILILSVIWLILTTPIDEIKIK